MYPMDYSLPSIDETRKGCIEICQGNFGEERSTDAKPSNHTDTKPSNHSPLTIRKPIIPFLFLFIALFFLSPTLAERTLTPINFNTEPIVSFGEFVFTIRGHVTIYVSSVSVNSSTSQPELSRFGFFLATHQSYYPARMNISTNPNSCILDSPFIYKLLSFRDLSPPPSSSFNRSFSVFAPGLYTLYFANCLGETSVSMNVITERYNINSDGVKEFLSAEQRHGPMVLAIFFVAYLCLTSFCVYRFLTSNPLSCHIHKSIIVILVIKDFYLICAVADKYSLQFTGVHHGLDMWVTGLEYIHVIVLFSVVVLIASGWRFLKPFLQNREKNMLVVVVFLQFSSTIASVFFAKELPPSRLEWGFFLTVDVLCCCAILCITFWSVKFLETSHSTVFSDVTIFKVFCFCAICYIGLSRAMPFFFRSFFGYNNLWVIVAEEIYEFLFLWVILLIIKEIGKSSEPIQGEIQLTQMGVGTAA